MAAAALGDAFELPSVSDLGGVDGRRAALAVHIADVDGGCHVVRCSYLLTLLGFGNARLKLYARLYDLDSGLPFSSFTRVLRHNGLSRGADDYLQDNGAALVKELSQRAAYDLTMRARKRLRPLFPLHDLFNRFRRLFGSHHHAYDKRNTPS